MPNPNEGERFRQGKFSIRDYHKELERKLKAPLSSQMRDVADVVVALANEHLQDYQKNEEYVLVLDNILRTHPEDLSLITEKDDAFRMAEIALALLIRKNQTENLCQRLLDATYPRANTATIVGLNDTFIPDSTVSRVLRGLEYAYSVEGREFSPEKIVKEAKNSGSQRFLDALALPGKPLIPYQRNVGERVINLEPTYDNKALKGSLQTKISGVTVQYVYPNSQNVPIMSIEIRRIP